MAQQQPETIVTKLFRTPKQCTVSIVVGLIIANIQPYGFIPGILSGIAIGLAVYFLLVDGIFPAPHFDKQRH